MGRSLRFVPEDHLVEVTCRTLHGRFLLRPGRHINQTIVGALGRAQRRYGLTIYGLVVVSNHYHLLCGPEDAQQLAAVMRLANSKIAREVGRVYNWKEKVWGRRYSAVVLAQEEEVHLDRLRYLLAHGVKEGLVKRVRDWPGVHCASSLLIGEPLRGLWFDRTAQYRARTKKRKLNPLEFATPEELKLTPLPAWSHLPQSEIQNRVQGLINDVEHQAAVKRSQGELPRPMRPARIRKQKPHHKPKKIKRTPAPTFHAKSKEKLRGLQEAYRLFLTAYLDAAARLRQGDLNVVFPEGSFPPPLPFVRGSPRPLEPG